MDKRKLIESITEADIPNKYKILVDLIGICSFVKLCEYACGDEIYFPMVDTLIQRQRNRLIIEEFNGGNISELARKYHITVQHVRSILKSKKSKK